MRTFFLLAAMKELRKKKKVLGIKRRSRRRRRVVVVKPVSTCSGIEKIPDDLLVEILLRLPPKAVGMLKCVSKLWHSLISSRHFTNLFLVTPSSADHPMRSIVSLVDKKDQYKHAFLSSSSSPLRYYEDRNKPVCRLTEVLDIPGMEGYFVNVLRGLLCVRLGRIIRICNLTTNQLVELPIIKSQLLSKPNHDLWTSFGYDPVHDEYKVFNIVSAMSKDESIVRSEHQVLVLGPQASWRNTKGHTYPHRPHSSGIFIKGAFYYRVFLDQYKCAIMSFDFNSEDFKLIELPIETGDIWWNYCSSTIMNYKDKIALFEYSNNFVTGSTMRIGLWVMEEVENNMKWSKITIELPLYQMGLVNGDRFLTQGTGRCNEIVSVNAIMRTGEPMPFHYLDLEDNKITKIFKVCLPKYLMNFWGRKGCKANFWEDNVENLMYLEI